MQAIYVPADDYTDPAPATTFAHLDATTNLSRAISELGIYPAVDPLASTSRILDPRILGDEHYDVARQVKQILQRYKDLQDIIAILRHRRAVGRRQAHRVARAQDRSGSSRSPSSSPQQFTGLEGQVRADRRHDPRLQGDRRGKHDEMPEQDFYMAGSIDEVIAKFQKRNNASRGRPHRAAAQDRGSHCLGRPL